MRAQPRRAKTPDSSNPTIQQSAVAVALPHPLYPLPTCLLLVGDFLVVVCHGSALQIDSAVAKQRRGGVSAPQHDTTSMRAVASGRRVGRRPFESPAATLTLPPPEYLPAPARVLVAAVHSAPSPPQRFSLALARHTRTTPARARSAPASLPPTQCPPHAVGQSTRRSHSEGHGAASPALPARPSAAQQSHPPHKCVCVCVAQRSDTAQEAGGAHAAALGCPAAVHTSSARPSPRAPALLRARRRHTLRGASPPHHPSPCHSRLPRRHCGGWQAPLRAQPRPETGRWGSGYGRPATGRPAHLRTLPPAPPPRHTSSPSVSREVFRLRDSSACAGPWRHSALARQISMPVPNRLW